jgi:hypothetical protein
VDLVDAINILIQKNQEDTQLTIQFQTLEQMKISTPQKKVLYVHVVNQRKPDTTPVMVVGRKVGCLNNAL